MTNILSPHPDQIIPRQVSLGQAIAFGTFRLAVTQRVLMEGDHPVRLGSRALEILFALIEAPGEIVTKARLMERVWPNVVVEEGTLRVHIAALRKALGDGRAGMRYIENVTGHGYRLVAPVTVIDGSLAADLTASSFEGSSLPATLNHPIGREEVVATLVNQLPAKRFVTIVGAGGIGKTTVALAIAHRLHSAYAHGVYCVDLSGVSDPARVASAVVSAFRLPVFSADPLPNLVEYLAPRQVLIVLDNCEHVIESAALVAEAILRRALKVDVLATSREPLRAEGEWVQRLAPLDLPQEDPVTAIEALEYSAIRLFAERAMANGAGFVLRDEEVPLVVQICRKLDGLPLAIELAAAAVESFGVRGLAVRLDDRLQTLRSGRRTAVPRHRTLRAMLDWSYEILSAPEQEVLRRLAVFAGSFDTRTAAAVIEPGVGDLPTVANHLADLAAKSLVVASVAGDDVHYRLLDTTREYALDKLAHAGELQRARRRHAELCVSWLWTDAEENSAWHSPERSVDDVRAALDWCFSSDGDACLGVRLIASSSTLWFRLSFLGEYRRRVESALEIVRATAEFDRGVEMELNSVFGAVKLYTDGPGSAVVSAFSRALTLAEDLHDRPTARRCLWGLHCEAIRAGEYATALEHAEQRGETFERAGGSGTSLTDALNDQMMAFAQHLMGDQAQAHGFATRILSRPPAIVAGVRSMTFQFDDEVAALSVLARVLWIQGFPEQAVRTGRQSVEKARELNHGLSICHAMACSGTVEVWSGNAGHAKRISDELMEFAGRHSLGYWQQWARCIAWGALPGDRRAAEALTAQPLHSHGHREVLATFDDTFANDAAVARGTNGLAPWCAPELLRVRATAMLRRSGPQSVAVESTYLASLDLARSQGALSWELRTATSLAEFLQSQGRGSAAREVLKGVVSRYSEGQSSADFIAAQTLLKGLRVVQSNGQRA